MTDRVNVPRDPTEAMLKAWDDYRHNSSGVKAWSALLAAAPKAEPVSDPYKLTAWVEEMTAKHGNPNGTDYEQGQSDMGVRIVSRLRSIAQPEATKVEQVSQWQRRVKFPSAPGATPRWENCSHQEATCRFERSPQHEYRALYTHPAPASDELLEALDYIASIQMGGIPVDTEAANAWCGAFSDAQDVAIRAIAKHKGPQS